MPRRLRTFIGTVVMIAFIMAYALVAMAIAGGRITQAPAVVQTVVFVVLGLVWIAPLFPLIRWMEGPRERRAPTAPP